ncbi:MAG: SCO family protein [Tatlockia sp.]|nr:SCO family protein [Tatlockia sp.]
MSAQKNRVTRTVVALLVFIALITGVFVSHQYHSKKKIDLNNFNGTFLEKPREVNQFSLTGIDTKPFDNESLKGQWTMIFFGFTNCGFVCPTAMAELAKMYRILEEKKVNPLPRVVMISIDPERDNEDKLKSYVTAFDSHFYGARGNEEVVRAMTKEMGIAYTKIALSPSESGETYDMQHSGAIMLFNPRGELNAFFTTPHQATLLAKDYRLLVSN